MDGALFLVLKQPEYKKLVDQVLDAAFISYISTPLSKAAVRALYGNRLENSVTTLENYSACAYAHFLQYGLCLSRREENKIQTPIWGSSSIGRWSFLPPD